MIWNVSNEQANKKTFPLLSEQEEEFNYLDGTTGIPLALSPKWLWRQPEGKDQEESSHSPLNQISWNLGHKIFSLNSKLKTGEECRFF